MTGTRDRRRAALAFGLLLLLACGVAAVPSPQPLRLRDDCDPATFNAAIAPGTCIGNGNTTFDRFIAELIDDQKVGAWRFNPDHQDLHPGQQTVIQNRGGETHSFTKVANFGGGFVPELNDPSGNPVPAPECVTFPAVFSTLVPAGTTVAGPTAGTTGLPVGETKFQCCIHPWMRTVLKVRAD